AVVVFRERLGARVELHVDAVRDDLVIAGEVRRYEVARGARHGDTSIELVHVPVTDGPAGPVGKGESPAGVERRDLRASGRGEDLHGEKGDEGRVVVDG